VKIGSVTEQVNAERFYFGKPTSIGMALLPGDYVQIDWSRGKLIAIVEEVSGKLNRQRIILKQEYLYSCRLLDPTKADVELLGMEVSIPTAIELAETFNSLSIVSPLVLGELARFDQSVPLSISGARLTGTHSCFFGASGSGKTTLLGLLLEEVLLNVPGIQIIVFDLNSDFARFDQPKTEAEVNENSNPCALIPPPVLKAQQSDLMKLATRLVQSPTLRISRFPPETFLGALGGSQDVRDELLLRNIFTDLKARNIPITVTACLEVLTQLAVNPNQGSGSIKALLNNEGIHSATLHLQAVLLRMAGSSLWSTGAGDSLEVLEDKTRPAFIQFDLGRMPFSERALFTESALSRLWQRNEANNLPTLIVIDEAHNVAPATPEPWQRRTLEWVNRISGEGRKYGLFLIVVSQRPAKIHSNTLDNCSNYALLRLQNQDDLDSLSRRTQEVSPALLSRVVTFRPHQALVFGSASSPAIIRTGRRRLQ
jgi:hypothetical protein